MLESDESLQIKHKAASKLRNMSRARFCCLSSQSQALQTLSKHKNLEWTNQNLFYLVLQVNLASRHDGDRLLKKERRARIRMLGSAAASQTEVVVHNSKTLMTMNRNFEFTKAHVAKVIIIIF